MNFYLAIYVIIGIAVISLILTLFVVKDVSKTLRKYEKDGDTLQNEIIRSHDYESSSLKINIRTLSWIYAILYLAVIIVSIVFIFFPF